MATCKWCLHWLLKSRDPVRHTCQKDMLENPSSNDTCDHWELDEEMVLKMAEDHKDEVKEQEALRRGLG